MKKFYEKLTDLIGSLSLKRIDGLKENLSIYDYTGEAVKEITNGFDDHMRELFFKIVYNYNTGEILSILVPRPPVRRRQRKFIECDNRELWFIDRPNAKEWYDQYAILYLVPPTQTLPFQHSIKARPSKSKVHGIFKRVQAGDFIMKRCVVKDYCNFIGYGGKVIDISADMSMDGTKVTILGMATITPYGDAMEVDSAYKSSEPKIIVNDEELVMSKNDKLILNNIFKELNLQHWTNVGILAGAEGYEERCGYQYAN